MLQLASFAVMVAFSTQVAGPVIAPVREAPLDRLLRFINENVGSGARLCGQFLIHEFGRPPASVSDLTAASQCVAQSRSAKRPASVIIQQQGIDSWVAYGVVVTSEGAVRRFSFDSDPSGGSGAAPRFSTTACASVQVGEDSAGWAQLTCHEP